MCKEFAEFKYFKSHNIEMAKEWICCQIDSSNNPKKITRTSGIKLKNIILLKHIQLLSMLQLKKKQIHL